MTTVPNEINGVRVTIAGSAENSITDMMLKGLLATIKPDIADGAVLQEVYFSDLKRGPHAWPSRHVTGNAVDLSRVNGKKMSVHYPADPSVKAITDALQNAFETFSDRRENFGPLFNRKLGQPHDPGSDHTDHVHWSVNGPHQRP